MLSLDEESQIQALDRTQPELPINPGRCQTMTHAYRHGTTILLTTVSVLDGTVIGRCMQRHRHMEFIRFLNVVEREVRAERPIHGARRLCHPQASQSVAWLSRHPRWTFHFIPTSASWLNAVENCFIQDHSPTHPPQRLPFDYRPPGRHQCLPRRVQCQSQTLRLDQVRRRDPCQTRPPTCIF
jgi:hypothetical protein